MNAGAVQILWDASHLWGLMALAAMRGLGVSCELIGAKDIAHGCLFRKQPGILVIPGGNARQKARALGAAGREAIRAWLGAGGVYLGFCGGAGLALEQARQEDGLGICPWRRGNYADRQSHLVSGHVLADTVRGRMALPVWWPGRFGAAAGQLEILAAYAGPGDDVWLGDRPLKNAAMPEFPCGQPLVIRGRYGQGVYILSYAHLETPASQAANAWLAEILREHGACPASRQTGEWRLAPGFSVRQGLLGDACQRLLEIFAYGERLGLFFRRTSWLYGWRQGAPGMICNYLLADLAELGKHDASGLDRQSGVALAGFLDQAELYFRNLRPGAGCGLLREEGAFAPEERDRIFGHAMLGGGLAGALLARLEQAIIRRQARI